MTGGRFFGGYGGSDLEKKAEDQGNINRERSRSSHHTIHINDLASRVATRLRNKSCEVRRVYRYGPAYNSPRVAQSRHSVTHTPYTVCRLTTCPSVFSSAASAFTSTSPLDQLSVIAPALALPSDFLSLSPNGCIRANVHFKLSISSLRRCTSALTTLGSNVSGSGDRASSLMLSPKYSACSTRPLLYMSHKSSSDCTALVTEL